MIFSSGGATLKVYTRNKQQGVPSLKQQKHLKMDVGIPSFPFGAKNLFSGLLLLVLGMVNQTKPERQLLTFAEILYLYVQINMNANIHNEYKICLCIFRDMH